MLDGLDSVPWETLHHAYGPATDIPDLLRALAIPTAEVREDIFEDLSQTIWHQGTVYEASAYAVPFLIALADTLPAPTRVYILALLDCLADGNSYLEVHANPMVDWGAQWRADLIAKGLDVDAETARERGWVRAAHDAVAAGYPVYLRLVQTDDVDTQLFATRLLARFPDHAPVVVPVLQQRFVIETDSQVRAGLVLALDALLPSTPEVETFFVDLLTNTSLPTLRFTAALSLLQRRGEQAPVAAVEMILEAVQATAVPWTWEDRATYDHLIHTYYPAIWPETILSATIKGFAALGPVRGIAALCQALDRVRDQQTAHDLIQHLLVVALGDRPLAQTTAVYAPDNGPIVYTSRRPDTGQDDYRPFHRGQRAMIAAIARCDAYWERRTNLHTLWGLPADRAELDAYRQALWEQTNDVNEPNRSHDP